MQTFLQRPKVKHETAPKNRKMIHDGSPEEAKTLGLFSFDRTGLIILPVLEYGRLFTAFTAESRRPFFVARKTGTDEGGTNGNDV